MRVAIIPARGGSKRIPRKNIRPFFGKPMIAWSIEAAIASDCFDQVIVSTDDSEIASIAVDFGAEVPFLRPSSLSDDYATSTEVVKHAVDWLVEKKCGLEAACCIYATAPFVTPELLRQAYELMISEKKSYAFTAVRYDYPIQRALYTDKKHGLQMFYPEYQETRSQDLVEAYHDAGQLYWGRADAWLNSLPIFSSHSSPLIIPRQLAQDIDTEEDWQQAELIYRIHSERVRN